MRLGLSIGPRWNSKVIADIAVEAENLGFDDVWVSDHYYLRDAFVCLAVVAARTNQITLGTAVASPFLRNPALLASAAASLHEQSDGRMVLSIGPGGTEFGRQIDPLIRKPVAATRQAVEIIRRLWTGEEVTYEGSVFSVRQARLAFTVSPPPLVLVAARGPQMLALAADIGDGLITHGVSEEYLAYLRRLVSAKHGETESNRDARMIAVVAGAVIDADLDRGRDRLRKSCILMAGGSFADFLIDIYQLDRAQVGHLREAVAAADWVEAERRVTNSMVDAFCLVGSPDQLQQQIANLEASGVDRLIISTYGFEDSDQLRKAMTQLAECGSSMTPDRRQGLP